jgi:glutamate-5-semialdehyde dehydrogenase
MSLVREIESDLVVGWAQLLETRQDVQEMLAQSDLLDLIIPRGGNQLVQMVMNSTKIPVLGHADGICHLYVHESADFKQAVQIAIDAKVQYPAACNSIETLLVDQKIASTFLPSFEKQAQRVAIILKGCGETKKILPHIESATEVDWRTEYGDLRLSVRIVKGLDEGIAHINTYSSHHTDSIAAQDSSAQSRFLNQVDSASVMVNASPRFADGFRYGLGAEVGISTSKLHARGPVGLEGLVIYKWLLRGEGHIVGDYVGPNAQKFLHKSLK